MRRFPFKRIGQTVLIATILTASVAVVYLAYHVARSDAAAGQAAASATSGPDASCSLQESKPVLIIVLAGQGAPAMCSRVIASSKGRYFTYYGGAPISYSVMCAVTIKHLQYSVLDIVPSGARAATRYSMASVCATLQNHHRLIGEGF